MDPFVVLIIDDDHTLLDSLELVISRVDGVEVVTAVTGAEALRKVAAHHPGLILADLGLPDMDGYEVCRRVRTRADGQDAQIWFITGKPGQIDLPQVDQIGAQGFLIKPFGVSQLRGLVRDAMASAPRPTSV